MNSEELFHHDSTYLLTKKYIVYKLMGTDFFIDHSEKLMSLSYSLLGQTVGNAIIRRTMADIFVSGETVQDALHDTEGYEQRGIGGVACMSLEGLKTMDEEYLEKSYQLFLHSIQVLTEDRDEG